MAPVDDRVISYVHEMRRRGHPDHRIKELLKHAGHPDASIDEHMRHPRAMPAPQRQRSYNSLLLVGALILIIAIVALAWPEPENRRQELVNAKIQELTQPPVRDARSSVAVRGLVNAVGACAQGHCINISTNTSRMTISMAQPPEQNISAGDWVEATCTPADQTCIVDQGAGVVVQRAPRVIPVMMR